MQADPSCPACGQSAWVGLGEQSFAREPAPSTEYRRVRHRVLFELWAPGSDRFTAKFVLCEGCGFVCFTPRPSAADIDAKYRLIASTQTQTSKPAIPQVTRLDAERSVELFEALQPHLPKTGSLLDFGGGAGALLGRFAAAGLECGVVDYTPAMVENVTRLGSTLDELPADAKFSVVLCSHVFEHVAEPVEVAAQLRARLRDDGILFIEVPLELVGGPPRMREPVTHVNFFCESSLATTLERAGLEVVDCRTRASLFANGRYCYAVRAVARVGTVQAKSPGAAGARDFLDAGPLARLQLAAANPEVFRNPLRALRKL